MDTETVTVLSPTLVTDPYSTSTVESWTTPTQVVETTLAPAEPRPSGEPVQDARNAVVSGFTLYLPTSTTVTAGKRVLVRGGTYSVMGDPAVWLNTGVVVQVERMEG